jgi:hypothetical protein
MVRRVHARNEEVDDEGAMSILSQVNSGVGLSERASANKHFRRSIPDASQSQGYLQIVGKASGN